MSTPLSPNFTLEELTLSQTASRLGLDNTPPPEVLEHLKATALRMEAVRALLMRPILVSSGYRSQQVNAAVGGVANSAHCQGWAVDFICPSFGDPFHICAAIAASPLEFDQVIQEGTWVHISFAPSMRKQCLTKTNGGYAAGIAA
jgi:hypothetical protein